MPIGNNEITSNTYSHLSHFCIWPDVQGLYEPNNKLQEQCSDNTNEKTWSKTMSYYFWVQISCSKYSPTHQHHGLHQCRWHTWLDTNLSRAMTPFMRISDKSTGGRCFPRTHFKGRDKDMKRNDTISSCQEVLFKRMGPPFVNITTQLKNNSHAGLWHNFHDCNGSKH